jgi:hypothetical protein
MLDNCVRRLHFVFFDKGNKYNFVYYAELRGQMITNCNKEEVLRNL